MTDIWFARWKPGAARALATSGDPVIVSVTEFTPHRPRTTFGVATRGMALRKTWPGLEGAIGMWLWLTPDLRRPRSGAISVWRTEADLHRFVARADHVRIMRAYRDRGALRTKTWQQSHFNPPAIRETARTFLAEPA
ncbi:hypothetical protein SAMN05421805_11921 [Saccharopolyspora antimicrobica]|uniref:DUF3291 domain-containing protein n=1 Tax=Saccharopolyspora antimicrobica TaxID=455193 RepID=A0A1I5ILU9_9PSEU|nr:hypothetical protein [Saccharopolyspora antimicrobica]RKT84042.1 hypothetical protein ATL45_2341 [Saccharopolyspora antimicrobica]SFO61432.1 hypothetical protein SAMN05421805_11921 [Saccharopolyspora antimicrobica]